MRTVTVALGAELALTDTAPAYLVSIAFDSGINRFCTRDTVSWDGNTWLGAGLTVEPPSGDSPTGKLTFSDADYAIHALIFGGPFKSRAVNIWAFWGAALDVADPVLIASCITTGAESGEGKRIINLQRNRSTLLQCPRQIIGPGIGVNFLAAAGEQIAWGGMILTLERPDG